MKKYADMNCKPLEFRVDDHVLLKLTPQIWKKVSSKTRQRSLLSKYDGPFEVFDEYLKYSFYPYALVSFSSVFMLNKCSNALKVHTYDQVIHLVELCKIGGKAAIEVAEEATEF